MAPVAASPQQVLLTAHQAAAEMAISVGHLKNLTATGVIPFVQLGRSVRYRRIDIEESVAKLVKQSTASK